MIRNKINSIVVSLQECPQIITLFFLFGLIFLVKIGSDFLCRFVFNSKENFLILSRKLNVKSFTIVRTINNVEKLNIKKKYKESETSFKKIKSIGADAAPTPLFESGSHHT